jgi:hypothetical protein
MLTMPDFDGTGFSAVDRFFEKDTKATSNIVGNITTTAPVQSGNARLGVGAKPSKATALSQPISNRILQVGKKRQIDQDDEDAAIVPQDDDDDDEEDVGRTAISTSKTVIINQTITEPKKKKGKKERQQVTGEQPAASTSEKVKFTIDRTGGDGPKRKRPKIRSKQKNVVKDTRPTKPLHLQAGHKDYQGRPLTVATKTKLNLPIEKVVNNTIDDDVNVLHYNADAVPLAADRIHSDSSKTKGRKDNSTNKKKYRNLL